MAKAAQNKTPEININLMPGEEPSGKAGGAVHWALTVGRYLIIITEIIAIAIFVLSIKFSSDKQNLKENIKSLTRQVSVQKDFEREFRTAQQRINGVKVLKSAHFENTFVVDEFLKLLPQGITLGSLKLDEAEISFSGSFTTPQQLRTLIYAFSQSEKLVGFDISELNSPSEKNKEFTFSASAVISRTAFSEEGAAGASN
ncbi:MAG: hypothetical protein Q8O75_04065 [bacterium]|nr:hypothetical protein [bacterium]